MACSVFLPLWMMRALGLRPRDVVCVELIQTVPAGASAKLRPRRAEFAKRISNPRSVLETELRHYSALTQGSTIAMDYNGQRHWLDVVELRSAPRGEKQDWIKCQDCDIATDFLPSKEDVLIAKKAKLQRQLERKQQQQE
jgi:Ubiquitin fusion degradation protein UFD1